MAFGFIKKVFSFGRKEAEQPVEAAPLPPVDWQALGSLKPADQLLPDFLKREELQPAPAPEAAEAAPVAEIPPPLRVPSPVEAQPVLDDIAPEPSAIDQPVVPATESSAPEPEAPPAEGASVVDDPLPPELPEAPAHKASAEPAQPDADSVAAEILPPLRQPSPIEATPILDEIAPEPEPVPAPSTPPNPPSIASPSTGKVTVAKAVAPKAEPVATVQPAARTSWFQRLREGLARSSRELSGNIAGVFTRKRLDEETLQDLEDVLIRADLGMETALRVTGALSASRYGKDVSDADVRAIMAVEIEKVLAPVAVPLELDLSHKPHVILVVGVNGTGKTTTIGKLAAKLTSGGLSVMLAAGDTFRAAAIEQLKIWGERTNSPVVASKIGADAAGLAWDAFEKAREAGSDVLIIDTAGRLQNRAELMAELEKIVRVLGKHDPEAPHTVLQTVDATTGQNALNQVEIFRNVAGVSGLVMTKLDGTARGGILVAIAAKHKLPVYFIGVGEQVDDLEPFSAGDFAKAIAGVA